MKRLLFLAALALLIFCGPAGAVDKQAPDFSLPDMSGKQVRLSDYRGKVVFLNFWATWCPPCRAEMPSMERLYEFMPAEDFVMLAVNVEPNGQVTVAEFLKENPHKFPVLLDAAGMVQRQYGVFQFPETFIIGRDGRVLERIIGSRNWSSVEALKYFRELVGK